MKWARLDSDNIVQEITDRDPAIHFHPSLTFVACPDNCTEGQVYDSASDTFSLPEKSVEEKVKIIEYTVSAVLDSKAREYGYDNIHTAVTYADEPAVAKFQTEGQALRAWRSQVWDKCYDLLAQWEAGSIPEQTPEEVIAQLPVFVAP